MARNDKSVRNLAMPSAPTNTAKAPKTICALCISSWLVALHNSTKEMIAVANESIEMRIWTTTPARVFFGSLLMLLQSILQLEMVFEGRAPLAALALASSA